LGNVTLGSRIGGGGYGEVFRAKVEPLRVEFALKLLNPSPFHTDQSRLHERFVREAEILLLLRHPNITPIFGVGEHEGRPYILMELFDGVDLNRARDRGIPSPEKVLKFIELVALGLGHAHQRGIVHRDVKPSNLLTRIGDARVVDFGIAQIMDPDGERFTKSGGTPIGDAYSAPELLENPRQLDPRSDIYSLGACWFWLLTGTTPRGRNWEEALRKVPSMTPDYEQVVLKSLDQVDRRYQSMDELAIDVNALRIGRTPNATATEGLDDDCALLLGTIFEKCFASGLGTSTYRLEQELAGKLSRFAFGIALRNLKLRKFIEPVEIEDDWQREPIPGFTISATGESWVVANRVRVEQLMAIASPSQPSEGTNSAGRDAPF
jgi:serine/threonine protein kinase